MEAKIRMKIGSVEFEAEGSPDFLASKLPALLENVVKKLESFQPPVQLNSEPEKSNPSSGKSTIQMSVENIAHKLGAKSCADLAFASAVHSRLVLQKDVVTRKELTEGMKSAKSFYKASMSGSNLSSAIGSLLKAGKLNEPKSKEYALTSSEVTNMHQKLAP